MSSRACLRSIEVTSSSVGRVMSAPALRRLTLLSTKALGLLRNKDINIWSKETSPPTVCVIMSWPAVSPCTTSMVSPALVRTPESGFFATGLSALGLRSALAAGSLAGEGKGAGRGGTATGAGLSKGKGGKLLAGAESLLATAVGSGAWPLLSGKPRLR